jgi:hypothetical protein
MKKIILTALTSSALTLCVVYLTAAPAEVSKKIILENDRVAVTERSIPPGGVRVTYERPTDQVIVFLNDTKYERIDSKTGEKIERSRKAGDTIWHFKGESAPKLVNIDDEPFRFLIIALK